MMPVRNGEGREQASRRAGYCVAERGGAEQRRRWWMVDGGVDELVGDDGCRMRTAGTARHSPKKRGLDSLGIASKRPMQPSFGLSAGLHPTPSNSPYTFNGHSSLSLSTVQLSISLPSVVRFHVLVLCTYNIFSSSPPFLFSVCLQERNTFNKRFHSHLHRVYQPSASSILPRRDISCLRDLH
jgi:hypothetical protein